MMLGVEIEAVELVERAVLYLGPVAMAGPRVEALLTGLRGVGYGGPEQIEIVLRKRLPAAGIFALAAERSSPWKGLRQPNASHGD